MTMGVITALCSCAVGCGVGAERFRAMSSSIDNFFSDSEFIVHILLQVFVTEQQAVTALPAAGCGVGNVTPGLLPTHFVAFTFHQRNELIPVRGVAHTVVNDVHELQLLALTTGRRVVLPDGHGLRFLLLLPWLKYRERKLRADLVVALPQFL